jgi:hypothetical protein
MQPVSMERAIAIPVTEITDFSINPPVLSLSAGVQVYRTKHSKTALEGSAAHYREDSGRAGSPQGISS